MILSSSPVGEVWAFWHLGLGDVKKKNVMRSFLK